MKQAISNIYESLVLKRPVVTLIVTLLAVSFFAWHIPDFKLDASGDSLVLENDADLYFYRQITERYGSGALLLLAYTAENDLFAPDTLADLKELRDRLRRIEGVESVTTILDVPLIFTTGASLSEVADADNLLTLEKSGVGKETVVRELRENPLYKGRLLSNDGLTTSLLINLPLDQEYRDLLNRRYKLRDKEAHGELTGRQARELEEVSRAYREKLTEIQHEDTRIVKEIRGVVDRHRQEAELYLGGVAMIVADMIGFIEKDLLIFGAGVFILLIVTLTVIFRRARWVILSLLCCGAAVVTMIGMLGLMDWRVTVISSNFISLTLILTMALTIHLIERYLEIHARNPEKSQRQLVLETVKTIATPCFYTALTTAVAFSSLVVSEIRPVIDFGLMMAFGLLVSFLLAFILFPASLCLLKKTDSGAVEDFSHPFTMVFAGFTERYGRLIIVLTLIVAAVSAAGITRLTVDNRFIDYFKEDTEIYQGMSLIDRKLGGTTPLDLIIDFERGVPEEGAEEDFFEEEGGGDEQSRWYADAYTMEQFERIHDFLDSQAKIGQVLSLATLGRIATRLNGGVPLANFELAILYKKLPPEIGEMLVEPYVAEDPTQARFAARIIESQRQGSRGDLLVRIEDFLTTEMGLDRDRIHFTNMYILYNNMLNSLFRSQIATIGMVFLGIGLMFLILFRSLYLALIGIVPNIMPVTVVLGTMGWLNIPLDMMTITIA
ncbi:MAG: RND family transporter, partial [Desulfurivibrionaceae bacterium]